MNWTREHDAWIARECEGLHPRIENGLYGDKWVVEHRERGGEAGWHSTLDMGHYNTDIAACIRAAEAWRQKREGRTVKIEWEGPDVKAGLGDRVGGWHQWFSPCDRVALALAWALYRATGGPA